MEYESRAELQNTADFLPIEKALKPSVGFPYDTLPRRAPPPAPATSRDDKLKIKTVCVSLSSNYDEVRLQAKHDSPYSSISPKKSLHVQMDPT